MKYKAISTAATTKVSKNAETKSHLSKLDRKLGLDTLVSPEELEEFCNFIY